MLATVRTRVTHAVSNLIEFDHDRTAFAPFVRLGLVLALAAVLFGPVYALIYMLSGDVAWSVVVGVAFLTLATGTVYCLIGGDDVR